MLASVAPDVKMISRGVAPISAATFARAAATLVLAAAAGPPVDLPGLATPPEHPIARLIEAGSHPDMRLLERLENIKTGALAKQFGKMKLGRALVVDGEFDKNFQLSARNLATIALLPVAGINVYDIMKSDKLVLTTAAVKAIEARLG